MRDEGIGIGDVRDEGLGWGMRDYELGMGD